MTDTDANLHFFESASILRYLANKYAPENNSFYPRDDPIKTLKVEKGLMDYYRRYRTLAMANYVRYIAPMFNAEKNYDISVIDKGIHKILGELD